LRRTIKGKTPAWYKENGDLMSSFVNYLLRVSEDNLLKVSEDGGPGTGNASSDKIQQQETPIASRVLVFQPANAFSFHWNRK
jgi:hypothetical protein